MHVCTNTIILLCIQFVFCDIFGTYENGNYKSSLKA